MKRISFTELTLLRKKISLYFDLVKCYKTGYPAKRLTHTHNLMRRRGPEMSFRVKLAPKLPIEIKSLFDSNDIDVALLMTGQALRC